MEAAELQAMFSGVIGKDYDMLKLICPAATTMSYLVGQRVGQYTSDSAGDNLNVIELGGGTGITTLAMLTAKNDIHITSIDNEPVMQNQAKQSLAKWLENGKLSFLNKDALMALSQMPDDYADVIASAYTLHNFLDTYRREIINEIYRVLKPGGQFINGDRYGLDNISEHTQLIQMEASGYFDVLTKINRLDLLEHWIVHLLNDESENHVMRESGAINVMEKAGFEKIVLSGREGVSALLVANKPF